MTADAHELLTVAASVLDATTARAAGIQQLTEQLSRALTPSDIGRLTATTAAALIGADACAAYGRREGTDVMESLHTHGWPGDTRPYAEVSLHRGRPMSDAVLTGEPVWLEDTEQWHARYPEMAPLGVSEGHEASAVLPLRVEERDLGAVVFSFYRPRAFDPAEREFLLTVASLCAQALDRARLYRAEHQIADTLQRSLLPQALPSLDRLGLAVRYLPGATGTQAGGDWYDVIELPDGLVGRLLRAGRAERA